MMIPPMVGVFPFPACFFAISSPISSFVRTGCLNARSFSMMKGAIQYPTIKAVIPAINARNVMY